tara:strand:- start:12947 stop:14233 length:1287 start_codon:yes stop_codon:yes gene_type:complete
MKKKISLILDNPTRDLDYIVLIGKHLVKNNCEVTIVPSNLRHFELFHLQPDYVLYPHQRESSAKEINILKNAGMDIGVMETEQHVDEYFFTSFQTPLNKKYLEDPIHIFSWGDNFSQIVLNNNIYSSEQVINVGNPRFDLYFHKEKVKKTIELLIGTTFQIANPKYLGKKNSKKAYLNENMSEQDYEEFFKTHEEAMRTLIELINSNFLELNSGIHLRPHPYEDENIYKNKLKHINIDNSYSIGDHLSLASSYLHYHSVSSTDSAVMQIPTINLSWFPKNKRLHDSTEFMKRTSYQPSNKYELKEIIQEVRKGNLQPKLKIDDKIFEQYFYRIDGLASKRIAEHILNNTTHKVNQYKNPEIIFNNLNKLNELVKHKIAVNRWKKTKKYFGISEIQDSIKKTTNPNIHVDMTSYINDIQLASIKITKKV